MTDRPENPNDATDSADTTDAVPSGRRRIGRRAVTTGVVAGAGLLLAGAVGVTAAHASGGSPNSAASTPSSGSPAAPTGSAPRPPAGPRAHPQPHLDGKVIALASNGFTVQDPDGFHRTVDVSSATTYHNGTATIARSRITVGSQVHATGTVDADHTSLDATSVDIGVPRPLAGGKAGTTPPAPSNGAPTPPADAAPNRKAPNGATPNGAAPNGKTPAAPPTGSAAPAAPAAPGTSGTPQTSGAAHGS